MRRMVTSAILFALSGMADASGMADLLSPPAGDAVARSLGERSNRGLRLLLPGWSQRYQEGIWRISTPHAGAHLARWRIGDLTVEEGLAQIAAIAGPVLPGFTPIAQVPMTLGDGRACRVIGRCRSPTEADAALSGIVALFRQQETLQALSTCGREADLPARLRDLLVATTLV